MNSKTRKALIASLSTRMRMHLNRVKEHDLVNEIYLDGQATGICKATTTRKPHYRIVASRLYVGDHEFDLLKETGDPVQWFVDHLPDEMRKEFEG